MDDELKELQELWQGQEAHPMDALGLIKRLNALEQKNRKEKRRLLALFPGTMLILLALLLIVPKLPLYILGISLIGLAMLMVIYLVYKNSLPLVSEEQDLDNEAFLKETVKKLKGRKAMTSRFMWLYTVLLVMGINIGYIDVLSVADPVFRILAHTVVTVALPIGNYFAIRKRMQQNEEELQPLIEQLESLQNG